MGRRRYFNALAAACVLSILLPSGASAQGSSRHPPSGRSHFIPRRMPEIHSVPQPLPQRFYQLSPDERQLFRRNAERWLQMNAQQQQMLRDRERMLREQRRREAEQTMHDLGLQLDNPSREQFEQRYLQERRRIERQLRLELETRRQQELPQLREKLKSEFHGQVIAPSPSLPISPRD